MIKSLHALRESLPVMREHLRSYFGTRPLGPAACEVFDELDRRMISVIGDSPPDAMPTIQVLMNDGDDWIALAQFVEAVLDKMTDLIKKSSNEVRAQRQPFVNLIGRIESEGYIVDIDTLIDVTDGRDWAADELDPPQVRVQLDAEQITRAQQAAVYQRRLKRMDAGILAIEADYAERIRRLAHSVRLPHTSAPDLSDL
ncbi:MAG: hypothetical protein U0R77_05200 [Mycolicibacterium insubricum]